MDLTTGEKRKADELERKAPEIKKPNIQHLVREPSILHIRPVDDIIKYIADFIGNYCHYKNVEVNYYYYYYYNQEYIGSIDTYFC